MTKLQMCCATVLCSLLMSGVARAADTAGNPLVSSEKGVYSMIRGSVMRAAAEMPEENYTYKPTESVRTYGQVLAHIADGQYEFCSAITGDKSEHKKVEGSANSKAEIEAALKQAFQYCDSAISTLTDAKAAEMVNFFGHNITRLSVLSFNTAHTDEHYGNLVTYLRMKGMVPPTSKQ